MSRDVRRIVAIVVAAIGTAAPTTLLACPVCFQFDASPVTKGVLAAVIVLVGVTVSVLGAFATFVRRFAMNETAMTREPEPRNPGTPEPRPSINSGRPELVEGRNP